MVNLAIQMYRKYGQHAYLSFTIIIERKMYDMYLNTNGTEWYFPPHDAEPRHILWMAETWNHREFWLWTSETIPGSTNEQGPMGNHLYCTYENQKKEVRKKREEGKERKKRKKKGGGRRRRGSIRSSLRSWDTTDLRIPHRVKFFIITEYIGEFLINHDPVEFTSNLVNRDCRLSPMPSNRNSRCQQYIGDQLYWFFGSFIR